MERKEIHALEYAVCKLVIGLDAVLRRRIPNWHLDEMMDIEILKHGVLRDENGDPGTWEEVHIRILPVGWPECSWISARFFKYGRRWVAFEGDIHALHIPFEVSFGIDWYGPQPYPHIFPRSSEPDAEILSSAFRQANEEKYTL